MLKLLVDRFMDLAVNNDTESTDLIYLNETILLGIYVFKKFIADTHDKDWCFNSWSIDHDING